jgi:hypothetical protein
MFVARLIENEKYYKDLSVTKNPYFLLSTTIIFFCRDCLIKYLSIFGAILLILSIIYMISYLFIINKRIFKYINNSKIKIYNDHIIIESKTGNILQDIDIKSLDKILLLEDYSIPKDNLKTFFKQITGKIKKFYIILEKDKKRQRFDILMPSHYMAIELNKIIDYWKNKKELNIEIIK